MDEEVRCRRGMKVGEGLRSMSALVWDSWSSPCVSGRKCTLVAVQQAVGSDKGLAWWHMLLPYHRALGSLFSSENCVGAMSKSGCQFTVLHYKDVEVFEICAVFHGKSRGGEEMNGEEERRITTDPVVSQQC